MREKLSLLAAAATAAVFISTGTAAVAAPAEDPPVILADGLVSPLHVSAGRDGTAIVSEQFAGRLTRIESNGAKTALYQDPDWSVGGNAQPRSTIYFVESQGAGPMDPRPLAGHVRTIQDDGHQRVFGDLAALETEHNADGKTLYGFRNIPAPCAAEFPHRSRAFYTGEVDSHPYGVAVNGPTVYVADAGANSVVSVDIKSGKTKTVAVLPPRPYKVTAELAEMNELPPCVVGQIYDFEPVPTDVAVGPDGWLYVTSLPGGPEDPALGARGAVFKVNPDNGRVKLLADEIMSPTGLAVDDDGDIYVASLFGEGVLKIDERSGSQTVVLAAALTADVDLRGSALYATVNALAGEGEPPNGQLVTLNLKHSSGNRDSG